MGRIFLHAHWMTVKEGVPVYHGTRADALASARKRKALAYRQEVMTGRLDIVYDPVLGLEYKPGERVVTESVHGLT